jgi:hypothetical protein
MSAPKSGDTWKLPSGSLVILHKQHSNDSFSCFYVNRFGELLTGRDFAPGVTLTFEFVARRCVRVG